MNWNYNVDFEWFYGAIILLALILVNRKKLRESLLLDRLIYIAIYVYIIAIIAVVFFPIPLYLVTLAETFPLSRYFNFIPLKTVLTALERTPIQPVGNFLLLLPFGVFYPIIKKQIMLKHVLFWGLIISVSIEIIQLILSVLIGVPFRIWDIDDLILNTLGASVGYVLFKIAWPYVKTSNINSELIKSEESYR